MNYRVPLPDIDKIRQLLDYNEHTGVFVWRSCTTDRDITGSVAGFVDRRGYAAIGIGGRAYFAHRLAWKLFYGEEPPTHIDHINGEKSDNRIENLRAANQAMNLANSGKCRRGCLPKGVSVVRGKNGDRFVAVIECNRSRFYIGRFNTAEQASAAYLKKAKELYGEFVLAA